MPKPPDKLQMPSRVEVAAWRLDGRNTRTTPQIGDGDRAWMRPAWSRFSITWVLPAPRMDEPECLGRQPQPIDLHRQLGGDL